MSVESNHTIVHARDKRIVRSGPHTLLPYEASPPSRITGGDDVAVVVDLSPVFDAYERGFGRTLVLGDDPAKPRLRDDLALAFAADPGITGRRLYAEVGRGAGRVRQGVVEGRALALFAEERGRAALLSSGARPSRAARVIRWRRGRSRST
ncbi:hypothetical protein ACH4ZU_13760 [Streptomyces sp. NPDC020472]|uniref:hypothetical protein n=1 Tax=Streptomyces sp. NPDC020472 TaxID=3365075 RepID=UPI00378B0796